MRVALAAVTVAGAVMALSARDGRVALIGLLAALVGGPLIAPGGGDAGAALGRIVAAGLAVALLRLAIRDGIPPPGSRLGWPAEALAATAACLAAAAGHETVVPGLGPVEATAAGFGLIVLAAAPLLERADVLRLGVGLLLALTGADLLRAGLAGPASSFESVVVAVAIAVVGGTVALAILRTHRTLMPTGRSAARPR